MSTDSNKLYQDLFGLFSLFVGLLLLISLVTYHPDDPSLMHVTSVSKAVSNKAGLFGSYVSAFLVAMLGIAAYFAPGGFLVSGIRRVMGYTPWPWWRWTGLCILAGSVAITGESWEISFLRANGGGLLGHALASFFRAYFGSVGITLFWGFLFLFSIQLVTGFSWLGFVQVCAVRLWDIARILQHKMREERQRRSVARPLALFRGMKGEANLVREPVSLALRDASTGMPRESTFLFSDNEQPASADKLLPELGGRALPGADLRFLDPLDHDASEPPWLRDMEDGAVAELAVRNVTSEGACRNAGDHQAVPANVSHTADKSAVAIREIKETAPSAASGCQAGKKRMALPPFSLLHSVAAAKERSPREVLEAKGKTLMTCLSDFGIQGELVGIVPGPVVTMFEVRPAAGVRVARIEGLSDDLALALKAIAVRVQAPIPGTDTVGIEIPNDIREIVCLKELFCSSAFAESDSLLTMALGKDIQGAPAMEDLARMPHLLVAGATGAGKSVCLNSILLSFLYKARPEEVKLLLVDPKRVEMAVYADLPHLVHPVVTEMELARNALHWAVGEMSERYNNLALLGVRNIVAYNEKLKGLDRSKHPELAHLEFMPYLVIVIDELADLMMTAAKEVEGYIMRLAQLARAAGIHMILATQRPSVDVVTGLIKANFPCRIAFQVTSKHDSRTILDAVGAEHLLGKGDMLFKPAGGKFRRLHGAFVSDDDVVAVTEYWRSRQKPSYHIDFAEWGRETATVDSGGNGGDDVTSDPVYADAVAFVREQGKATISLIQRRFRIGFNRAARFIEQMEQDGIIGPADGAKPRIVR